MSGIFYFLGGLDAGIALSSFATGDRVFGYECLAFSAGAILFGLMFRRLDRETCP